MGINSYFESDMGAGAFGGRLRTYAAFLEGVVYTTTCRRLKLESMIAIAAMAAEIARIAITSLKPRPIVSSRPPVNDPKILPKRPVPCIRLTPTARIAVG